MADTLASTPPGNGATKDQTEELKNRLEAVRKDVAEIATNLRTNAKERMETVGEYAKEHPVATLGVGIGVGFILGLVIGRGTK